MELNKERIDYELNRQKMGKPELANKMGMSKQWIYQVLNSGKDIRLSTVEKFAHALGVDPKDLII